MKSRLSMLALEPRMVFDGAGVLTADQADLTQLLDTSRHDVEQDRGTASEADLLQAAATLPVMAQAPLARNELVVVDGGLDNLQTLLDEIAATDPHRSILVLDPTNDEVNQLTHYLQQHVGEFDAIHVLSHGGQGQITLGGHRIDLGAAHNNAGMWSAIRDTLTPDGDLLLYGCEVADGASGQAAITQLAQITGADIAASADVTGAMGDWDLEYQSGSVETTALQATAWQGSLTGNLIVNGTFEAGNTSFTTQYVLPSDPTSNVALFPEGIYMVGSDASTVHPSWTGSGNGGSGNFLIANGDIESQKTVWQSNLFTVAYSGAAPLYRFEAYVSTVLDVGGQAFLSGNGPSMRIQIGDGTKWMDLGTTLTFADGTPAGTWRMSSADSYIDPGNYYIRLVNESMIQGGNDLGLDDIYFGYELNAPSHGTVPVDPTPFDARAASGVFINSATVTEGTDTHAVFTITAAPGRVLDLTVTAKTASANEINGSTPTDGSVDFSDFQWEYFNGSTWVGFDPFWDQVTVPAGGTLQVRTAIVDDTVYETPEKFTVQARTSDGMTATGLGTILSNDSPPSISISSVVVNEGSPYAVVEVSLSSPSNMPVTFSPVLTDGTGRVREDTTGTWTSSLFPLTDSNATIIQYFNGSAWVDYSTSSYSQSGIFITIPAGSTSVLLRTMVRNDTTNEVSEYVNISTGTVSNVSNTAGVTGTITILDQGADTTSSNNNIFKATNTTATPDALTPVSAAVVDPLNIPTGQVLLDDDRPLTVTGWTINEAAQYGEFTVSAKEDQYVRLLLSPGGTGSDGTPATAGTDYVNALEYWNGTAWTTYTPGTFVKVPGDGDATLNESASLRVRVAVNNDNVFEGTEKVKLSAYNTNYQQPNAQLPSASNNVTDSKSAAVGFIKDDGTGTSGNSDDRPTFSVNDVEYNEAAGTVTFTVTKTGSTNLPSTVAYATSDGTAAAGVDYTTTNGTLSFAAGETSKTVTVAITNDAVYEGAETFNLNLSNATNATIADPQGVATIKDDGTGTSGTNDDRPSFAVNDVEYNEAAGTVTFTVTKTGDTSLSSTVAYATSDGTALAGVDYTTTNGTLSFAAGETSKTVTVAITNDAVYEMAETFHLNLSNPTNAKIADPLGVATIKDDGTGTGGTDDDRPSNPAYVNDILINEGSPYAVFTVTGVPTAQMTLALASDTAVMGTDFNNALEVFVGGQWVVYTPTNAVLDTNGQLLVRTTVNNQQPLEGTEYFKLNAQYTGVYDSTATTLVPQTGYQFSGRAAIVDDGTGMKFPADNPATPGNESTAGVTPAVAPVVDPATSPNPLADDDRPVLVNDVTVQEGGYAVFTVTAKEDQYVKLELAPGTATTADYTDALEYWNGSAWVAYTPGTFVKMPSDGDSTANETANLLVRVATADDAPLDGGERFQLKASNTGGGQAVGVATILDGLPSGVAPKIPEGSSHPMDSANHRVQPSLYVHEAVVEGRQTIDTTALDQALAINGQAAAVNVLYRSGLLLERLERLTDPDLHVLNAVRSARDQSTQLTLAAYALHANTTAGAPLSSLASVAATLAEKSLTEVGKSSEQTMPATGKENDPDCRNMPVKTVVKRAVKVTSDAAKDPLSDVKKPINRGQLSFSQQLKSVHKRPIVKVTRPTCAP